MPNKPVTSKGTDKDTTDSVTEMDPSVTVSAVSPKGTIDEQVDSLLNAPNTNPTELTDDEGNPLEDQEDAGLQGDINVSDAEVDEDKQPQVEIGPNAPTANPNTENVVMTVEGKNGAENLPADYDNLNAVPTVYSNPPAADENRN